MKRSEMIFLLFVNVINEKDEKQKYTFTFVPTQSGFLSIKYFEFVQLNNTPFRSRIVNLKQIKKKTFACPRFTQKINRLSENRKPFHSVLLHS